MASRRTIIGLVALAAVVTVSAGAVLAADGSGATGTDGRTVTVGGTGEVDAAPNTAVVRLSVTAQGEDAAAVSQELASGAQQLRSTLTEFGLGEDRVQTDGYSVYEDPGSRENPNRTVYRGEQSFSVTLDDVDSVGALIDAAVGGGADDVSGVQYTLSDQRRSELRDEAITTAIDEARSEAAVVGSASNLTVGQVRHASTQSEGVQPYRVAESDLAMDSGGGGTNIDPRDVTVTATVEVTFDATTA